MLQQRKDDFLGIICHELKTPLTILTATVQLLNKRLQNGNDIILSNSARKAEVQIKKMGNLINGFLNTTFLESGNIQLNKQKFNLNGLIGELIEESRELKYDHYLHFYCFKDNYVLADRVKIGCVISNLICNAMKYSPDGKNIYISCFNSPKEIIVRIRDEGIGIKTEHLEKLFDRFYRVESDFHSQISGFGIGLYLCDLIIKAHGGRIWAESEISSGSVFYFSLPLNVEVIEQADVNVSGSKDRCING